jgi:anthranilate phosphoribosyltransferase
VAVLMAAGATLVIADVAADWKEGARKAAAAIDDGCASRVLEALVRISAS